jgi:serine phosphatase RsbU (regulator of sigma subunit)
MRIAAEIQQALLPKPRASMGFVEAAAASVPCRSIGGDFFDYIDQVGTSFGFTLGDVAGKGPPAALMSAMMQGMFAARRPEPRDPRSRSPVQQGSLPSWDRGQVRHAALRLLTEEGKLTYCNAGHNPPIVLGKKGLRALEAADLSSACSRRALLAGDRAARCRRRDRALQ